MMDDTITTLLRGVADGSISVDDARTALEGAELTEEEMSSAIDHGVFNIAEPGTIVSASLAPSGAWLRRGAGRCSRWPLICAERSKIPCPRRVQCTPAACTGLCWLVLEISLHRNGDKPAVPLWSGARPGGAFRGAKRRWGTCAAVRATPAAPVG